MTTALSVRNATKIFGAQVALSDVSIDVEPGEVRALVGQNGCGKSTLIKIVTGYHTPTTGEIYFDGEKIEELTVSKARELGVETVYQERALAELQTLWRNIFLGRELSSRLGFLKVNEMKKETHG